MSEENSISFPRHLTSWVSMCAWLFVFQIGITATHFWDFALHCGEVKSSRIPLLCVPDKLESANNKQLWKIWGQKKKGSHYSPDASLSVYEQLWGPGSVSWASLMSMMEIETEGSFPEVAVIDMDFQQLPGEIFKMSCFRVAGWYHWWQLLWPLFPQPSQ